MCMSAAPVEEIIACNTSFLDVFHKLQEVCSSGHLGMFMFKHLLVDIMHDVVEKVLLTAMKDLKDECIFTDEVLATWKQKLLLRVMDIPNITTLPERRHMYFQYRRNRIPTNVQYVPEQIDTWGVAVAKNSSC